MSRSGGEWGQAELLGQQTQAGLGAGPDLSETCRSKRRAQGGARLARVPRLLLLLQGAPLHPAAQLLTLLVLQGAPLRPAAPRAPHQLGEGMSTSLTG